ncbi:hypothetical protein MmiAt1_14870 [Methanimicrococcus sp. At1]|uniref:Uncharacterized protein n=1 Tax=Methanimicrococcus hacksteinii TaxID=3028293 RepID=A0ABU3VR68_9EURY|nr:hypothetical protein [Methanimicrococcus sp. At1]
MKNWSLIFNSEISLFVHCLLLPAFAGVFVTAFVTVLVTVFVTVLPVFLLFSAQFCSAYPSHFYHIRSLRERGHRLPYCFRLPLHLFCQLFCDCRLLSATCRSHLPLAPASRARTARFSKNKFKTNAFFTKRYLNHL